MIVWASTESHRRVERQIPRGEELDGITNGKGTRQLSKGLQAGVV